MSPATAAIPAKKGAHSPLLQRAAMRLARPRTMAPLSEKEALQVFDYMHPYTIPAGQPFILEDDGQHNDFAMLILSGDVVVESSLPEKQLLTVNVVSEGTWVGELAFLDGLPRQAACRAADYGDVLCAILSRQDYQRLLDDNPRLAAKLTLLLAANVARYLREADKKMRLFAELNDAKQIF